MRLSLTRRIPHGNYGWLTSVLNAPLKFIRNWNGAAADLGFRIGKN
jgi:hypothetical protein